MTSVLLLALAVGVLLLIALVGLNAALGWLAARAVPARGRFVEVRGHRLHYIDQGQGAPIVLIHGLGGQIGNFSYALTDLLAARYRVVALDRPGSGYSKRCADAPRSLSEQAQTVLGLIRLLQLPPVVLVGHSLGGAVALAAALDAPEAVAGVALLAPLTQYESVSPAPFRALAIGSDLKRQLFAWTLATPLALFKSASTLRALFTPNPVPADLGLRGGGLLSLRPQSFVAASVDMTTLPADVADLALRYEALRMPVGILFGRGDAILDHQRHGVAMGAVVRELDLQLIDGGHMLPISHAQQSARFIERVAQRAFDRP